MINPVPYVRIAVFALLPIFVYGQTVRSLDEGILYSHYFSPKEYKANPQNWAVLQMPNGVMAFGNGDGIMTFDGSKWRLTPLPNNNLVRVLAFDDKSKLFAGGYNELGFVEDDTLGVPRFISIVRHLSLQEREFGHVWNILQRSEVMYFTTDKSILVWKDKQLKTIYVPHQDSRLFTTIYNSEFLVQPSGQGLSRLNETTLMPLPGGEFYVGKRITGVLPYDANRALVCTLEHGLFLYDGNTSIKFLSQADRFLRANRLYKAIRLSNGNFAIGTLNGGVLIIDNRGTVLQLIEKGRGLGDNAVYNLTEDSQGALWVTMSVGISRVEIQNPMTWFDERNGLAGAVNDIIRFQDDLYVATMLGFFKLKSANDFTVPAYFEKVDEVSSSVWAMASRHGSMLLATDDGTVELRNNKYRFLDEESGAVILASSHDPNVIFVGLADGVVVLQYSDGQWRSLGRMNDVEADVGEINEDAEGNIWLGTFSEGAVQLQFKEQNGVRDYLHPLASIYNESDGLPVGYVQIHSVNNELIFRIEPHHDLLRFNKQKKKFEPFQESKAFLQNDSIVVFPFSNEVAGKQWMFQKIKGKPSFDLVLTSRTKDEIKVDRVPFSRVREDIDEVIYTEDNGVAWLGGLDGVVRFKYNYERKTNPDFQVHLTEIRIANDSLLYSGARNISGQFTFPYDHNTLDFAFSATGYDLSNENEYQYFMEGFDDDWSHWTKETTKSYTKIPEGSYQFRVRARDIYSNQSAEAKFTFQVSPPWFRHPLAYVAYVLAFTGILYAVVKSRSRKLEKEKAALEKIVQERTIEVSNKNLQLEQQAEELRSQTEQLKEIDKIKSHFFTNISHEFRTPLSLIIAPLEKALHESTPRAELNMMYRNAKRLQNLIDQLLDLAKLEAGQMKIFLSRNDLVSFTNGLLSTFQPMAEARNIQFRPVIPSNPIDGYFDADKLETILYNLLSNAFKFTPEGGTVSFSLTVLPDNDHAEFIISDTGPGIAEEEQSKIFDRFYQVDGSTQREFEGSGIGLALTKELVMLLDGDIFVESALGKGTTFRVVLPFSKSDSHVIPDEIRFEYQPKVRSNDASDLLNPQEEREGQYNVLLVEDNPDMNAYLVSILEKSYNVTTTFNGEQALASATDSIPDLILSDMMMPQMDGFTLCELIRKNETTSHIPFVLLTARSAIENRLAGLELGADDYITKPFNVAELQIRIKNLLEQRDNLKKRFRQELRVAPKDVTVTSTDEKFLLKVMEVVEQRIGDVNLSVEELSSSVGMSRKNLHRKLVSLVGQSPNEFIRIFRLKKAMQLLQQKYGSVKEVAFETGFNNLSYFSKCFRTQFGVSPADVKVETQVAARETSNED